MCHYRSEDEYSVRNYNREEDEAIRAQIVRLAARLARIEARMAELEARLRALRRFSFFMWALIFLSLAYIWFHRKSSH